METKLKSKAFQEFSEATETMVHAGCQSAGQKEKALETLKTAEAAFQEMGMDYWLRRTQEVLEKL